MVNVWPGIEARYSVYESITAIIKASYYATFHDCTSVYTSKADFGKHCIDFIVILLTYNLQACNPT